MLIGKLAELSGFSRDTIRFYEKQGLIAVGKKQRRSNNYKEYPETALSILQSVRRLKNFGFTLQEIAGLLEMIEAKEATCKNVGDLIESKVALLNSRIRELIALRDQLIDGVNKCNATIASRGPEDNCPILLYDRSHN